MDAIILKAVKSPNWYGFRTAMNFSGFQNQIKFFIAFNEKFVVTIHRDKIIYIYKG